MRALPGAPCPVYLFTTRADALARAACIGANSAIEKPFDVEAHIDLARRHVA